MQDKNCAGKNSARHHKPWQVQTALTNPLSAWKRFCLYKALTAFAKLPASKRTAFSESLKAFTSYCGRVTVVGEPLLVLLSLCSILWAFVGGCVYRKSTTKFKVLWDVNCACRISNRNHDPWQDTVLAEPLLVLSRICLNLSMFTEPLQELSKPLQIANYTCRTYTSLHQQFQDSKYASRTSTKPSRAHAGR